MILIADVSGERLDAFLARSIENMSRSGAQKLLEEGCVLRCGKPGKKNDKLNIGDEISVTLPEPKEVDIVATQMELDIVYEDDDVLVINKPKGLVVHPAAGHQDETLVNGLLYAMEGNLSGINGELRPGIVHRIDKDTSGLLAVAKNDFAHTWLASQLKDHSMARTYEAIVCGNLKEDSGTVDAPIGRHPSDRKKMCVTPRILPAICCNGVQILPYSFPLLAMLFQVLFCQTPMRRSSSDNHEPYFPKQKPFANTSSHATPQIQISA